MGETWRHFCFGHVIQLIFHFQRNLFITNYKLPISKALTGCDHRLDWILPSGKLDYIIIQVFMFGSIRFLVFLFRIVMLKNNETAHSEALYLHRFRKIRIKNRILSLKWNKRIKSRKRIQSRSGRCSSNVSLLFVLQIFETFRKLNNQYQKREFQNLTKEQMMIRSKKLSKKIDI